MTDRASSQGRYARLHRQASSKCSGMVCFPAHPQELVYVAIADLIIIEI